MVKVDAGVRVGGGGTFGDLSGSYVARELVDRQNGDSVNIHTTKLEGTLRKIASHTDNFQECFLVEVLRVEWVSRSSTTVHEGFALRPGFG